MTAQEIGQAIAIIIPLSVVGLGALWVLFGILAWLFIYVAHYWGSSLIILALGLALGGWIGAMAGFAAAGVVGAIRDAHV